MLSSLIADINLGWWIERRHIWWAQSIASTLFKLFITELCFFFQFLDVFTYFFFLCFIFCISPPPYIDMGRNQPLDCFFFFSFLWFWRTLWGLVLDEFSPNGFTPPSSSMHGHVFIDYVTQITFMSTMKHYVTIHCPNKKTVLETTYFK